MNGRNWEQYLTSFDIALHGGFIIGFDASSTLKEVPTELAILCMWAFACSMGRNVILRRLDSKSHKRIPVLAVLALLRAMAFLVCLDLWIFGVAQLNGFKLLTPLANGIDPSYVPRFAGIVVLTLLLFVLWSLLSWLPQLAPVIAASCGSDVFSSIRTALRTGPLRGKLIEINFVMGIVKVALLVLAMVFSACPLPFSNVETQAFLNWWWFGCFLFWVIASDYFHVVRAVAYLRLWEAYQPEITLAISPDENPAS